jgi:hypothetical protein
MQTEVTTDQVRTMLEVQGLRIPEDELKNVAIRFSTWLAALAEIEAVLGDRMNEVDPIPPVYPQEEF